MGNSGWNLEQCMSLTMRINISFESIYHFLCRLLASHFVVQGAAHHLSTQVPNTGTTDMNHHFLFCPNMIFSFYLLVSQKDQCYSPVFSLLFNMFIICRLLMCNATSFNILEKQQVQNVLSSCYIFFVCVHFLLDVLVTARSPPPGYNNGYANSTHPISFFFPINSQYFLLSLLPSLTLF